MKRKIGLIVNPIAGMGGKVGLKGTDGEKILEKAYEKGAKKESPEKVKLALKYLKDIEDKITIITYPNEMGESECLNVGLSPIVIGKINDSTTWKDTEKAAKDIVEEDVELIIFAGGDGTARNIFNVVKDKVPVIGIPTGVKIHSAVFANNSENAGKLAADIINDMPIIIKEREVMDVDENDLRHDRISAKLYGYMKVPYKEQYIQNMKSSSNNNDENIIKGIAKYITDNMEKDCYYIIGAGTTTREIMTTLNTNFTLLGPDVIFNKTLFLKDANEKELIKITKQNKTKIIITPIGGQGFIFGRGNQQISPEVIRNVGKENIIIISSPDKLLSIMGKPLLVDTGDIQTDEYLKGTYKIVVGYDIFYAWRCA